MRSRPRLRRLLSLSAILVLLPLAAACSVPRLRPSTTATLRPSLLWTQHARHRGWNAFPTCSYSSGTRLLPEPAAGEVLLGFARSYDDRFCWEQLGEVQRVLVRFDVGEIARLKSKIVVSARLQIGERVIEMRSTDGESVRSGGTPSCLGGWFLPDGDPRSGDPWAADGRYTFEKRDSAGNYQVTGLVSSWVTGFAPNNGILLRAEDENTSAKDDAACVSGLSNLTLVVTYRSVG